MKPKELRSLSRDELHQKMDDLKKQIFELNFQRKYGKVEKPHLFRLYKKDISRILTVLKEKGL